MKYPFYLVLLTLLFSCQSEKNIYKITFENINGLAEGNPVIIKDVQIGEVREIALSKEFKISVEIMLDEPLQLPKDSKFTIGSRDLFTNAIIIIPGTSKKYLKSSDKIIGQKTENILLDSLMNIISDEFNNLEPFRNQDSIISELNTTNTELKKLNKKIAL